MKYEILTSDGTWWIYSPKEETCVNDILWHRKGEYMEHLKDCTVGTLSDERYSIRADAVIAARGLP